MASPTSTVDVSKPNNSRSRVDFPPSMAGDGGLQIDGYNGDMMGMSLVWDIMGYYGMLWNGISWHMLGCTEIVWDTRISCGLCDIIYDIMDYTHSAHRSKEQTYLEGQSRRWPTNSPCREMADKRNEMVATCSYDMLKPRIYYGNYGYVSLKWWGFHPLNIESPIYGVLNIHRSNTIPGG